MKGIYEDARCMYKQGDYPRGSTEKRDRRPKQAWWTNTRAAIEQSPPKAMPARQNKRQRPEVQRGPEVQRSEAREPDNDANRAKARRLSKPIAPTVNVRGYGRVLEEETDKHQRCVRRKPEALPPPKKPPAALQPWTRTCSSAVCYVTAATAARLPRPPAPGMIPAARQETQWSGKIPSARQETQGSGSKARAVEAWPCRPPNLPGTSGDIRHKNDWKCPSCEKHVFEDLTALYL